MTPDRPTAVELLEARAECSACMTVHNGPNALALAAQHHDRTGHPITTTISRRVSYGSAADHGAALEAAGQSVLELEPPLIDHNDRLFG